MVLQMADRHTSNAYGPFALPGALASQRVLLSGLIGLKGGSFMALNAEEVLWCEVSSWMLVLGPVLVLLSSIMRSRHSRAAARRAYVMGIGTCIGCALEYLQGRLGVLDPDDNGGRVLRPWQSSLAI